MYVVTFCQTVGNGQDKSGVDVSVRNSGAEMDW